MMTKQELHDEFWLLAKSVLEDSRIDAGEAKVLKRWLEEHAYAGDFSFMVEKLNRFLADGYIDRAESSAVIDSLGRLLAILRTA